MQPSLTPAPLYLVRRDDPLLAAQAYFTTAPSGDRLRVAILPTAKTCRGSVVFSVGRSEQIEKYGEVAGEFANRGFNVLLQEWGGQGLSGRYHPDVLRAHVTGGWRRHLDNFDHLLEVCAPLLPQPWIASAHSMGGGLLALALAKGEARFRAAVLCAPMCGPNTAPFPRIVAALTARAFKGLRLGGVMARVQLDYTQLPFEQNRLTHDRDRFERTRSVLIAHPQLQLGEPTFAWVSYAFDIRSELRKPGRAEAIQIPVAIVAAAEDEFVDGGDAAAFAARLPRGTFETVAGARHEILMEKDERRAVFWRTFDRVSSAMSRPASEP